MMHPMKKTKSQKGFMAIKIDLEKVYDMLRYSFIVDVLKELKIPYLLCGIVMDCICTSTLDV